MRRAVFGWCVLGAVVACGHKVVFDGPNANGSGNGGATSAATNSSSSASEAASSTSTGSSSSGGGDDVCTKVCSVVQQCGTVPNCVAGCKSVTGDCKTIHDQWLSCLLDHNFMAPCSEVSDCVGLLVAYHKSCGGSTVGCSAGGSGPTCSCKTPFAGHTLESTCNELGGGNAACDCAVDGVSLGKCSGPVVPPLKDDPTNACHPVSSCCAALHFTAL